MRLRSTGVFLAVAALFLLPSCGGSEASMAMDFGGDCPGNWANISLQVEPTLVTRGDPVTLTVTWEVTDPLSEPVIATLLTADNAIEVDVPLGRDMGLMNGIVYAGQQLNPFGVGAPAGTVSVLASGNASESCGAPTTATASFQLD